MPLSAHLTFYRSSVKADDINQNIYNKILLQFYIRMTHFSILKNNNIFAKTPVVVKCVICDEDTQVPLTVYNVYLTDL